MGQIFATLKYRHFAIALALCCTLLAWTVRAGAQTPITSITATIAQVQTLSKETKHSAAAALGERWFELYPENAEAKSESGAHLWSEISIAYLLVGQYEQAVKPALLALSIRERIHGSDHPNAALSMINLAWTFSTLAQYDKALALQQRALNIFEKTLGPEHPNTAWGLNNLALTLSSLGQHDKSLPHLQRALTIREKTLGPEHPDVAQSLSNLASIYSELSEYDKAIELQTRALSLFEKTIGPEHPNNATILNNLSLFHRELAQFHKAIPLQQRALNIFEKTLGPEHPNIAISLGNLATIYNSLAQYDKALPLQQRALAIFERVQGQNHPNTALGLNNLAHTYIELSEYDKAIELQTRALSLFENTLGPEHPNIATSLGNLASTYSYLGQHDKALPLLQRALTIFEKTLGPEHPKTAHILSNLASIYSYFGQNDKALSLLQHALLINEKSLGTEHPTTATELGKLASILKKMDHPDLATAFYKSAVNAYQKQREQVARINVETLRSYTESVADTYQSLAVLLVDQGLLPEAQLVLDMLKENELFEFIRRNASADPRLTRIGYNAIEQKWMNRYQQISMQLTALGAEERALAADAKLGPNSMLNPAQQARQKALHADLAVARKAFEKYMADIQSELATKGVTRRAEVAETSVQATRELQTLIRGLGEGVVLLQYFVTGDQVNMLLTTPGVQLVRSAKVSTKELNSQIAALRSALRDPKSKPLPMAQALYRLLLAPVEADLIGAGAKVVMLSLDGTLRYLPFGALHDGQRYASERWNLPIYTSVVRDKLRDSPVLQWQAAGLGLTRAVGEFSALPAVRGEMVSIVRTSSNTNTGVVPGEVYLDEAFTATRLKDVGHRKFELLHVASHFLFSPGTEVNSFLLLGDGQQLTLGDIRTQNYRFDNVDLLTLSACDTGLGGGRDAQGREIEGFGVIAQQQGAKAVLATLWPVADQSTATLMADMYRRRQSQGLSKIEALRQAQLALMQQPKYTHPFYWAPFILMGNWR